MSNIHLSFQRSPLAGRKQFEVPKKEIERIQLRLAKHGISATAVWPQDDKQGVIEVRDHVQAEAIVAALA